MRKILSLVLVLALVLGAFPAFAATDQLEIANMLKEYKVLIGDETGDLMLDEYLTREQALVVLARLMGMENEAKNTTFESSFTDVDHPYYEPFIAFAESKGWTNGIGNGLFGYGQFLTAQQAAAYMLRALGYDVAYEDVMAKAEEMGILKDVGAEASASILRGQVAVMMYNTLMTKPNNSDVTLLEQLGLTPLAPAVATIQKVEANNLKQLKVYFTAPVDKAGNQDNWSVNKKANFKITKDAKFELSEDKMMVTITFADGEVAKQQEVVTLTCKGILDNETVVEDIQFLDNTIPEVESVEVIGINMLKVTFSEPMNADAAGGSDYDHSMLNKSNYSVKEADGGKLYIDKVESANNGLVAFVKLYSELKEGEIVVKIEDIEDFQDFNVKEPATFTVKVVKDVEKPYIVGFKDATPYEITLVWNEDIRFVDTDNKETTASDILKMFYHTNKEDTPEKVKIDGKEMTLTFEEAKLLPRGTAYLYVKDEAVQDYWMNKNDDQMFVAEVTIDNDAPEIVGYKQKTQNKMEIKFNEEVYETDDYKITVLKENGEKCKATVTNIAYKPDGTSYDRKVIVLTFSKDLTGNYTLVFEKVEDRSGNRMPKTNYDVVFEDKVRPNANDFKVTAFGAGEKEQKILIDFDEKMDVDSITDPQNYSLTGTTSGAAAVFNLDDDAIDYEVLEEGQKLLITVPWNATTNEVVKLLTANTDHLRIGQLKDAAGNKMTTYTATLPIANGDNTPINSSAKLTDQKTLVVTFKDDIRSKLDLNKVTVGNTTSTGSAIEIAKTNVELKDGKTVVTFTFKDKQGTVTTNMWYKVMNGAGENRFGQKVATGTWGVTDKAAPEVKDVYFYGASKIVVEFTEDIKATSVAGVGRNGFKDSDNLIPNDVPGAVYLEAGHMNCVVLTENDADENFDVNTDVSYDGVNNLQDAAGNTVKQFDRTKKLIDDASKFPF